MLSSEVFPRALILLPKWVGFDIYSILCLLKTKEKFLMERTLAEMEATRARGRVGGRPKGLTKKSKNLAGLAESLYLSKKYTTNQICEQLHIESKATLYSICGIKE